MLNSNLSYKINIIGEFSDKKQEEEYFRNDNRRAIKNLRVIVIFLEVLNTLFLIPEFFMLKYKSFEWFAGAKLLFLVFVIIFLLVMNKVKKPRVLTFWISMLELYACILFLIGLRQHKSPDFLLQALSIVVVIVAVFMVPNRWINMLLISVFTFFSFILISVNNMEVAPASDVMSAVLYLLVVLVFGAITSYNLQYNRRMNYANSINLMKLSMTDHLTQIYNRGKLEDELQYQIENARKHHKPLTIILFDFDNFKIINDTFGHLDGDRLIVEVTEIVRDSIREEDIFARWGGDEFVILIPNKKKENGIALAERLRNRISSNKFKVEVEINCSFGVAELTSKDDSKGFIDRADKLLYQAKSVGGNCVKS